MTTAPSHLRIRRSAKAKRLRLSVKPGQIELVVPAKVADADALAFLNQHRPWAEAKLLEMNAKVANLPTVAGFASQQAVPWRGQECPLLIHEAPGLKIRVAVDESIRISLPTGLSETRDDIALRAFYAWTRRWLRERVAVLAARHAPRYKLQAREIRIKRMKTRWGSCGPRNDININWLLALAPESVLEYVVVHELCHIRERNHSPAFWSLVTRHLPAYATERRWLKSHGAELMRRFNFN
jgi:predicted metal-dependent hydrolase